MKSRGKRGSTNKRQRVNRSGVFITFEGIEGCGKTTQCRRLTSLLREHGYDVVETREPGGTPSAEQIREILLRNSSSHAHQEPPTPETEAALIFASRAQHVTHVIAPALSKGTILLCDRFSDSTLAYQGYGRGLSIENLRLFNNFVTHNLTPDHTFLFDLSVKQGLARRKKARNQNRLDRESLRFHERVRKGFLALAESDSRRITIIDSRQSLESISSELLARIAQLLHSKRIRPLKGAFPIPRNKASHAI